jgi:hypothetical protein
MDAKRVQRSAIAKLVAAGSLLGIAACFTSAHAQFVNPVPPTSPTFNSTSPSVAPQAPETPVAPSAPSGLASPGASPSLNTSVPPAVIHQPADASASEESHVTTTRGSHRRVAHRWRGNEHAVRVAGPSYFPGLGIVYPPYPNPCHWVPAWDGSWHYLAYSCS